MPNDAALSSNSAAPPDPKRGEREYFARVGPAGIAHGLRKPFSDPWCPEILADVDALFHFLAPPPGRLIEFGCGVGWLSLFLAERGYDVLGVDIAPEAIAAAQQAARDRTLPNARFVLGDYEDPPPDAGFDYALFFSSLHHAEDERLAVRRAYEALRPGGVMLAFETGIGHSQTPGSIRAVQEFGVHEKDMPSEYVAKIGREIGFRRHVILQRPHEVVRLVYRSSYGKATSQWDLSGRYLLGRLRLLRRLFRREEQSFIVLWK